MRKLRLLFATLVLLVTGVVATNAEVVYVEVDLTSQFNSLATTQWTGSSGQVGWAAPAVDTNSGLHVAAWERYDGNCTNTGDVMKSTVTGLTTGTYKIELYGAAAFTFGRGFGSTAFTGDLSVATNSAWNENDQITESTGVTLYAKTSEGTYGGEIPISYATNFNTTGIATVVIPGVVVGANGEIEIGMTKTSTSTNWHVIQLKGVTALVEAVPVYNQALSDAQAALTQKMSSYAQNNLSSAISTYGGLGETGTAAQYTAAIEALNNAVSAAQVSIDAYAAFRSVIDIFSGAQQDLDENGQAAYDDGGVLSGLEAAYSNGSLQEINSDQRAAMANALAVASKAQTTAGTSMSWAILNHSFEAGSLEAWTNSGMQVQANKAYAGHVGDFYAEAWQPNGTKTLSQTVTGMPGGQYQLTFNALARGVTSASVTANDKSSGITIEDATNAYTIEEITVGIDGELAIAYEATGTGAGNSWIAIDEFQLTYLGCTHEAGDPVIENEVPATARNNGSFDEVTYCTICGTEMNRQPREIPAIGGFDMTVNVTGDEEMDEQPTITVTEATQCGDDTFAGQPNSTITITPPARDGYTVNVIITQTPLTGGPAETVNANEEGGTWSFTLPDANNDVTVSVVYEPITYAVTLTLTGNETMETTPAVSLTGGTPGDTYTATAGSTISVTPQVVEGYTVEVTVTETAHVGDPQTVTPTEENGVWSFTQPDYNTTVTVAYTQILQTITWAFSGLEESVEEPAVTFSGEGVVPVVENEVITSYQCPQGTTVTFSAPEIEGYENSYIYDSSNGLTITPNQGVYSFLVDVEDHNIQIIYTKVEYTISGLPATNTTLTIGDTQYESGDVTATEGTVITVTPDLGYQITAITATYTPATGGDPIELTIDDAAGNGKSFTMPAANVTVTCTAEEIVIDPNAIAVTVPALSFVTYVDNNQDLSLATGDQAQLYGVSNVTDTEVQLTAPLTDVPSGHHFLIYNPTDADIIAQLMPSAPTAEMEGVGSNWYFFDMNGTTINPDDYTGFTLYICGGKQFLKAIGEGQLADHRWMLAVDNEPSDGGMKSRNIVFGETTNKITATNIKNATKGDVFDLQGRKVKAPKKGLYIVNGKKAVIK